MYVYTFVLYNNKMYENPFSNRTHCEAMLQSYFIFQFHYSKFKTTWLNPDTDYFLYMEGAIIVPTTCGPTCHISSGISENWDIFQWHRQINPYISALLLSSPRHTTGGCTAILNCIRCSSMNKCSSSISIVHVGGLSSATQPNLPFL